MTEEEMNQDLLLHVRKGIKKVELRSDLLLLAKLIAVGTPFLFAVIEAIRGIEDAIIGRMCL